MKLRFNSLIRFLSQIASFIASDAATYSASIVDSETVFYLYKHQEISPLASINT